MEKLVREIARDIKSVLAILAFALCLQVVVQSCSAMAIQGQLERIANKTSDAAPETWARVFYREFGGNMCGGRK